MSRTMGSVTGAGVLTVRGTVVVGSVAGSVVVVVATLKERVVRRTVGEPVGDTHATATVTIAEPDLPQPDRYRTTR